ncbi:MAG TPA: DUF3073 domain-containing protein [Pseudonocardiaceae bacterium]|jgi:hypothetical protein
MGRGRAKAKQTKVARELKYSTHNMDYEALQRELSTGQAPVGRSSDERYEDSDDDDDDDRR